MNYYRTTSIYQPTNVFEASASNSSASNVWDDIGAAARRMPYNVRTVIVPSQGEVSVVSPVWNSVPVEIIPQETFSAPAGGNVHINWLETMDTHVIKADVPGMRRQDLQVLVQGGPILQISGERFETWPFDNFNRHQVERWIGGFVRRFQLPDNVVVDRISAELDLGVLTITIPKLQRFPSVQWFIPIRTVDSGRSFSLQAEGSLTDVFPPRWASNISDNGRPQITDTQDNPMPTRAALVEVGEKRRLSEQTLSQTGTNGAGSMRRNSERSQIDYQPEEDDVPGTAAADDEIPSQATDFQSEESEIVEEPNKPEVEEDTDVEETVRSVVENILQALEADQNVNRTKSPIQSRRSFKSSLTNTYNSLSNTGKTDSKRSSRRASQISGTTNELHPPEASASTQGLLEKLGNALQRKISQSSSTGNSTSLDLTQDSEATTTAGSRRTSRRASQTNDKWQRRNSQIPFENDPQSNVDQNPELGTTGSRRASGRDSQIDENTLHRRSSSQSSSPENAAPPNRNHDNHEPGIPRSRTASRQGSETDESALQRRYSQNLPENAPEMNAVPGNESGIPRSRRASGQAFETNENALQRRSSEILTESNPERDNVGQGSDSRSPGSTRPLRRAYTEITDATNQTETSVLTENSPGTPEDTQLRRASESDDNDAQKRPTAVEPLAQSTLEKPSSEAQGQSSRRNSQSSRR